jgi:ribosomal protein L14
VDFVAVAEDAAEEMAALVGDAMAVVLRAAVLVVDVTAVALPAAGDVANAVVMRKESRTLRNFRRLFCQSELHFMFSCNSDPVNSVVNCV